MGLFKTMRAASTLAASSLLLLLLCVLARPSRGARLPTDYRPTLHPPADVLFVVPDRSLSHLLTPAQWKGIEGALDAAKRHPSTRIGEFLTLCFCFSFCFSFFILWLFFVGDYI